MPEGIGYGMISVAVPNTRGRARAIPAKGLPTVSNGPAPREARRANIPANAAKPDRGAAVGGGPKPRRMPDEPMKTQRGVSLGGQRMRERGRGFSKVRGR